jgi:DNA-binding MarR family transcriptional regulator
VPRTKVKYAPVVPRSNRAAATDLGIVDGLVQLSFLLHGRITQVAAAHELSITQTRLLGILRDREPGMLELARFLGLEKSSATGLIDRAENRGLVQRIPAPGDRRGTRVRLTPAGRKLAHAVAEQVGVEVHRLTQTLSRDQRHQLSRLASQVVLTGAQLES